MGVISKQAVVDFLDRPLRDSAKAKRFTDAALDRMLAKVRPKLRFHTPPKTRHKVCILLGIKRPGYMHMLDLGLGKTYVYLMLLSHWIKSGKVKRGLALVPNAGNIAGWIAEAKKHAPWLKVVGLDQTGAKARTAALKSDADLVVCTYMGWCALIKNTVYNETRKKNEWTIDHRAAKFEKLFQAVAFDEITYVMHRDSLFSRAAHRLSRKTYAHVGMTGTIFGKNPEAMWSQFYATDLGDTLGPTLGLYRAAFFNEVENQWSGWPEYKFDQRMKEDLARMIRHGSITYFAEECEDLPPLSKITKPIVLPPENFAYQKSLIAELKRAKTFTLKDNLWHRRRQLPSGYLTVRDPEGEDTTITFKDNPKMEVLIDTLNSIREDKKIIVYADYRKTGDLICERLAKEKIKYLRFYSKTRSKGKVLEQARLDPTVRVLVGSKSIIYGHNLQEFSYIICYETPVDPKDLKQLMHRHHRVGQTKKCFMIYLVMKKTIDVEIMRSLKAGRNLYADIVGGRNEE